MINAKQLHTDYCNRQHTGNNMDAEQIKQKLDIWKGYFCLLTDTELKTAMQLGLDIHCTNCTHREICLSEM